MGESVQQLERPRSRLYALEPIVRKLPEVAVPKRHVSFKEKFIWTGIALIAFFIMTQIPLYGMGEAGRVPFLQQLRLILASHAGTLVELGIGPIVTAGIIMQLLVGSKVIGLDLSQPEDRALYTSVQKLLAILMGVFQACAFVIGQYMVPLNSAQGIFLVIQLVLGVIILVFLDEVVSKYGFGSGISLFIVAGVAGEIFWQAFNPMTIGGEFVGAIPFFIATLIKGGDISDAFFKAGPNMMGVFATLIVFFVVVYFESMRIEIPLAYGRFGGVRGRYPIRFLYTSVIPVILAMVVFANIQMLGAFFAPLGEASAYLNPPTGIVDVMTNPFRSVVYMVILVLLCMGFALLWVNMTGMGPRDVARQLDRSGMLIPGFRRDVKVMEWVLSRYIITAALLGGALVGAISAGADFLGAIGGGTGILLTVGIMYSLYEEISRERVMEMFPAVRRFLGG